MFFSISRTEHRKIPQTARFSSTDINFPTSAEIVVAGAGAVGASVAYHLTKYGKKDVLVLEQGRLDILYIIHFNFDSTCKILYCYIVKH